MQKKRIILVTLILVFASLACAAFDRVVRGIADGGDSQPTLFPTPLPTLPLTPIAPTQIQPSEGPNETPISQDEASETPNGQPMLTPTERGDPSTKNFFTCVGPCIYDGSNDQGTFPERTKIVYFTFEYENFPVGASYTRWWTLNGVEWARYQCAWPGPESGLEQITLTEPNGLASGTWQVTITIDGIIVLQETLVVQGSWSFWDPAGFFSACYGKR